MSLSLCELMCVCVKWGMRHANENAHVCNAGGNMRMHFQPRWLFSLS